MSRIKEASKAVISAAVIIAAFLVAAAMPWNEMQRHSDPARDIRDITDTTRPHMFSHYLTDEELASMAEAEERDITLSHLFAAFAEVESGWDSTAYNAKEDAAGILQIRMSAVREFNRIVGYTKYGSHDRYSVRISKEIFDTLQLHHNPTLDIDIAVRVWNKGAFNNPRYSYHQRVRNLYQIMEGGDDE